MISQSRIMMMTIEAVAGRFQGGCTKQGRNHGQLLEQRRSGEDEGARRTRQLLLFKCVQTVYPSFTYLLTYCSTAKSKMWLTGG